MVGSERWKAISGVLGNWFEVSDLGRVRSATRNDTMGRLRLGQLITNARVSGRYMRVRVMVKGVLYERCVHHLVLEAFVGPRPHGFQGCHNDGNVRNNTLPNLRWDTCANNSKDKIRHGTIARGERNGWAKLTADDVRTMRNLYRTGTGPTELSRRYGIARRTVQQIVRGKSWAHIEGAIP